MAEPVAAPEGRNRRLVMLAGGAAALLLALVVLPGVLFGGGGGDDDFSFGPPVTGGSTPTTVAEDAPDETFEGFTSKNPFTPLVATETPAAPADDAAAPVPEDNGGLPFPVVVDGGVDEGDDGGTVDDGGVAPPAGDGSGEPGGGEPDGGAADGGDTTTTTGPPPRQPDRVSLLEVFTDPGGQLVASVRVNDTTYQVAEGDDFARSYRVLDLDGGRRCGQFLFGDDRFGLCEGDETLK